MKICDWKLEDGRDFQKEQQQIQIFKAKLQKFREKYCRIKGALWYKSRTLTPFVAGAREFINADINEDLKKVVDYLYDIKAKTGKDMVLHDEERDTYVLLIQASEFKRLAAWSLHKVYEDYIKEGLLHNINAAVKRSEIRRNRTSKAA